MNLLRSAARSILVAMPLSLAALLGGCGTPGPAAHFYLLTPAIDAHPSEAAASPAPADRGAKPIVMVVKDIRLPHYLDRPQIVTRDIGNRLELSEVDQWGGHLPEDLARVLATNLGRLLEGDHVVTAFYPVATPPDYRIEVTISSFERQPNGHVRLAARWWITRGTTGNLVASADGDYSGEQLVDGADYDGIVNSMSAVYGELARGIARSIRASVSGAP